MNKEKVTKRSERGQSLFELAISLTFLMILLAGVVDLGRGFFTWLAMRDAAQEGASYGSINPTDEVGMRNRVWDNMEQIVGDPPSDIVVNISVITQPCLGNTIQVDVNYPNFTITMPFLGAVLGSQTIPIHATVNDTILTPTCH